MKKLIYMILALVLALSLVSCGRETAEGVKNDVNDGIEDVKEGADEVKDDLDNAGNNIKDAVEDGADKVKDGAEDLKDDVTDKKDGDYAEDGIIDDEKVKNGVIG